VHQFIEFMARKIYIGRLPSTVSDQQIHDLFKTVGGVLSVRLIKESSQKDMYGYVQMSSDEETRKAIRTLDNTILDGTRILVVEAHFLDQERPVSYQWKKRPPMRR